MMTSPLENLSGPGGPLKAEAPHTLGLGPDVWRVLDKRHRLRNQSEYEGDLAIDERIVADLIVSCNAVAAALTRESK